ncbi:hypothetical protein Z043_124655, partial [Scleropages formosus]
MFASRADAGDPSGERQLELQCPPHAPFPTPPCQCHGAASTGRKTLPVPSTFPPQAPPCCEA